MNILLDFMTAIWKNGGGEWTRRVYLELFDRVKASNRKGVHFFALYDSTQGIGYEELREEVLGQQVDIKYVDINKQTIPQIVEQYRIDKFFDAMSQFLGTYEQADVEHINCEVICVTHDSCNEDIYYNHLDDYYHFINPVRENRGYMRDLISNIVWLYHRRTRSLCLNSMQRVMALVNNNPRVRLIAVSDYTKHSMQYNFGLPSSKIDVMWSPERVYAEMSAEIENPVLRELVQSGKRFYLLVHAYRIQKNPYKAVKAFEKYAKIQDDKPVLLALKYNQPCSENVVAIQWLSDSDLANAYKHCYALIYPSFFEGFGYPPLEAMHYDKPVLCSNATSMPEIFEDAPVYFNPLYETAIFDALLRLNESNYADYSRRSHEQYAKVAKRQNEDLDKLINLILA